MKVIKVFARTGATIIFLLIAAMTFFAMYSRADQALTVHDEKAIEGVVQDFVSAWNRDDANAFLALFIREGTLTTPIEAAARSRKAIRKLLTQDREELFENSTLKKELTQIKINGEGGAIAEGTYTLEGLEPGLGLVEVSVKGEFRFYLEKQKEMWLIKKCDIRPAESQT